MFPFALTAPAEHFFPLLASFLVATFWQGLALVMFTACALRFLPRLSAAVRSAIWTGVLVLTALLPWAAMMSKPSGPSAHGVVWHARFAPGVYLIAAWVLAAGFRFAQLAASTIHLRRVLRRAEPFNLSAMLTADLGGAGGSPRVCVSPDVDRPSIAGFLQPCILLPPGLPRSVSELELRQILLHECEHLRRHDHWINLLGQTSLVLFPLSPALIWINRRLALERELACDDRVLQCTGARKAYAVCLTRVAESSLARRGLSLAIGILGARRRGPDLARRVERILAPPLRPAGRLQSRMCAGMLCVTIMGGVTLLAHSPELVSFAPLPGGTVAAILASDRVGAPQVPVAQQVPEKSQVVPVIDRMSPLPQRFHATLVRAVFRQPMAPRRAHRAATRRSLRVIAVAHQSRAIFAGWQNAETTRVSAEQMDSASNSPIHALQLVPVLLRLSSPAPESGPAWYTAIRTPDGWVVVPI